MTMITSAAAGVAITVGVAVSTLAGPAVAWEPTKTVEFIVPAGTGGGADQMARMIQGIVQKHNLMSQPMVVINKSGGAGAEGFLDVKGDAGAELVGTDRHPHAADAMPPTADPALARRSSNGRTAERSPSSRRSMVGADS